jgi:hypothetical protein
MLGSDAFLAPRVFVCNVIMCSKNGLLLSCTSGTFIVRSYEAWTPVTADETTVFGATLSFAIKLEMGRLLTVARTCDLPNWRRNFNSDDV